MQPRNHNAVAAAVVQGRADWGMTLDTIARRTGLGFIPVQHEQYDFRTLRNLNTPEDYQRALADAGIS